MNKDNRIESIDIMRGLTLFLMLFVNDLYVKGVPKWMVHTEAREDGMGLADWVFPGFLFMVGLSIPFAFAAREKLKETNVQILVHIVLRTLSLLLIGVFMVNTEGYNADLTGLPPSIWALIVYLCIFLIWNKYPVSGKNEKVFSALKIVGIIGLIGMAAIYRSGTVDNPGWMSTSWWGILGLIGWGYFVTSLTYLFLKDNLLATVGIWLLFVLLNMATYLNLIVFPEFLNSVFGVILSGNVPSIVLAGLVIGIGLKLYRHHPNFVLMVFCLGIICVALGFSIRPWFIISKILATPSWAFICNGISMVLFAAIYLLFDRNKSKIPVGLISMAGKNSLTTYLAPDIIYYILWMLPFQVLFYKQDGNALLAIVGSVAWALLMLLISKGLYKMGVRLKL